MNKDAYWFPHDSTAHGDPKIKRLLRTSGWDGYGVYWALVELLRNENEAGYMLPLDSIDDLCYTMRIKKETVDSIFDAKLLQKNDKLFWSQSLIDRMSAWDEKRKRRVEAGRKGGKAKAKAKLKQKSSNAKAKAEHCSSKKRREEKRREENTIEPKGSCEESVFTAPRSGLEKEICDALARKYKDRLSSLNPKIVEKLISNLADPVFSGVNVPAEISKAAIWEDSNPTKRKTPKGTSKFLTQWMTRCQDDGARNRSGANGGKKIGHLAPVKYEGMYD